MKDAVFVQYVTDVQVSAHNTEGSRLLLVQAKGISDNEVPGIPSLICPVEKEESDPEIMEFDFVIHNMENTAREHHLEWEVKEVILMDDNHANIHAVKVRAANNADIALVKSG
ncbi:MAG: hypothetical protein P8100_00700 [bacterium]